MRLELDSYYTPPATADMLIETAGLRRVRTCFDSNCGDGSLLEAAARRHKSVRLMGLDKDAEAIQRLRGKHPTWLLSTADALRTETWSRAPAATQSKECDLVTMNPPFSMLNKRGIAFAHRNVQYKCSVAMAHIATTITKVEPQSCCAIVPESLMNSQLDEALRRLLERDYIISVAAELKNSTFSGARANALVLNLSRRRSPRATPRTPCQALDVPASLVRGGLPVHEARFSRTGLPFLHSTEITSVNASALSGYSRVPAIERGVVSGHVILLPRVGVPLRPIVPVYLPRKVQLSDCVIALRFQRKATAQLAATTIEQHWSLFVKQWRGTGARYITVRALAQWCVDMGILQLSRDPD